MTQELRNIIRKTYAGNEGFAEYILKLVAQISRSLATAESVDVEYKTIGTPKLTITTRGRDRQGIQEVIPYSFLGEQYVPVHHAMVNELIVKQIFNLPGLKTLTFKGTDDMSFVSALKQSSLKILDLSGIALEENGYKELKDLAAECPSLESVLIDQPAKDNEVSQLYYTAIKEICAKRQLDAAINVEELGYAMEDFEVDPSTMGRMSHTALTQFTENAASLAHNAASVAYNNASSFVSGLLAGVTRATTPSR